MNVDKIEREKTYIVFVPANKNTKKNDVGAIGDMIVEKSGCRISHIFGLQGQAKVQFFEVNKLKEVVLELENKKQAKEKQEKPEKKKFKFL